jgi:hypothetical protein
MTNQVERQALQKVALKSKNKSRDRHHVIPLTARMANRQDICRESFTVILNKSEKLAYDHHLKVPHIRTLLYCKALDTSATSIDTIAEDLQLTRADVINSIRQLRKTGFITTTDQCGRAKAHG